MAKVTFTAGRLAAFKCPADKQQVFLWDSNAKGLGLRATQNGQPAFIFEGKFQGKTVRIAIGSLDAWTIPQAQAKARELQRLIDEGKDPRSLKHDAIAAAIAKQEQVQAQRQKAEREALTFGEVWQAYIADRRKHWGEHNLRDHQRMVQQAGQAHKRGNGVTVAAPLAVFVPMRLIDINAEAVEQWAAKEGQERPTRARLAKRLLRAFLNWCQEQKEYEALTPAKNPSTTRRTNEALGKAEPKQVVLLREQLPAWFVAVKGLQSPAISAYLQCLLLTGARPTELRKLRWDDINTQWNSLSIRDKVASQGGRDGTRIIPLTPYVKHLILQLPKRNEWVFSSELLNQPISSPNHRLGDVCAVAGIQHLTIHDLRRSFGSLAEWLGKPEGVINNIQGHAAKGTAERHYRVRPLDMLRLHHEKVESWILEQAGLPFDPDTGGGKLRLVKSA